MNRLKELRIEKGLLQSDIAKIIAKGTRIIGFYETGERDMGTETLAKLSEFFNVSIDYLLGKSDIRNSEEKESSWLSEFINNYVPPSEKQKEQIKELIKVIMKDNKKENK